MTGRRDPTRSIRLRGHGRALVKQRVHNLSIWMRQTLKDQDAAGLRGGGGEAPKIAFINWPEAVSYRLARTEAAIEHVIEQALMVPPEWPRGLIERSVGMGIEQVEQELKVSLDHLDDNDVVELHAALSSAEVRGIASETQRRIMRLVVAAIESRDKPEALMREVRLVIEKIARLRLNMMVNTGVVRAVNAGKLAGYEASGITQVGIDPEWVPRSHSHDSIVHDVKSRKAKRRKRVKENKSKRSKSSKSKRRAVEEDPEEEMVSAARSIEEQILAAAFPEGSALMEAAEEMLEEIETAAKEDNLVNVLTAGDDDVCQDCEDIAAEGPYDIDEARDLIPAHPNCRCAFVPFGDKRFAAIMEQEE
jgi:hypothetical protein